MMKENFEKTIWSTATLSWIAYIFSHSASNAEKSAGMSGSVTRLLMSINSQGFAKMSEAERQSIFEMVDSIVRKCAHMVIFFILAALILVLIRSFCKKVKPYAALAFAASFAVADEFHQIFTSGRSAQISDIVIDTSGAALGILLLLMFFYYNNRCKWREKK